jgi:outer membrane receptor protein involved in Fe transport
MGYWKANYTRGAFRAQSFMNILNGQATNVVSVGPSGAPILLDFDTKTFDVEVGDTRLVQGRHVLTYGGNLRLNRFTLTIAPGENSRTEGGGYIQDEFLMNDDWRFVIGGRLDKFSSIENAVFSPRLAAVYKLRPDQSVRASYNRAFRAPSMINNNLQTTLATPLPLGLINPALGSAVYLVPTTAVGNPDLTEEHIDAFEVSFTGAVQDRATVTAALYYNRFSDEIFFTQTGEWGPFTPPPGFPLPAIAWAGIYQAGFVFPSDFTYLNLGEVTSKGIELGIEGTVTPEWHAFANYAYQAEPNPEFPNLTPEEALAEINLPAQHLFNVGVSYVGPELFGSLSLSRSSEAFWQDVLDSRFHGFTEPYTMVNLTVGRTFQQGRYTGGTAARPPAAAGSAASGRSVAASTAPPARHPTASSARAARRPRGDRRSRGSWRASVARPARPATPSAHGRRCRGSAVPTGAAPPDARRARRARTTSRAGATPAPAPAAWRA